MDRKSFLKQTTAAGVGLSVLPHSLLKNAPKKPNPRVQKMVIVAGAGIAGLSCAWELLRMGHEVVILEASGRIGGTVRSVRDGLADGLYADFGAENFTKPGYQKYWGYIEEFEIPVLPYYHRENRLTRQNDGWVTQEDRAAARAQQIREMGGYSAREQQFLDDNPGAGLEQLYLEPYLDNFTNEYQPFGVGYDHLENVPLSEIYREEGASDTALRTLGGGSSSALYQLWQAYIMRERGYWGDFDLYRVQGGNQRLTDEFGRRLGEHIRLDCQILEIEHGDSGVTVHYREFGEDKRMSADYLANCLPVPAMRNIIVTPDLPAEKQFIFNNVTYAQTTRVVFQARSEFWKKDDISINLTFNHPALRTIWQVAEEVDTQRVALMAKAPGGTNPLQTLDVFKEFYPGNPANIDIEQHLVKDWSTDQFAPGCERGGFPMGEFSAYWPHIIRPFGRIHFAGSYADNRSWGMEAATNSANRVAQEIDQA